MAPFYGYLPARTTVFKPKARFVVFGCRPEDQLLVENHTDDFDEAVGYWCSTTIADYTARVWDNEDKRFIRLPVLIMAAQFLTQ